MDPEHHIHPEHHILLTRRSIHSAHRRIPHTSAQENPEIPSIRILPSTMMTPSSPDSGTHGTHRCFWLLPASPPKSTHADLRRSFLLGGRDHAVGWSVEEHVFHERITMCVSVPNDARCEVHVCSTSSMYCPSGRPGRFLGFG